jgi:hypothetical protein
VQAKGMNFLVSPCCICLKIHCPAAGAAASAGPPAAGTGSLRGGLRWHAGGPPPAAAATQPGPGPLRAARLPPVRTTGRPRIHSAPAAPTR